MLHTMKSRLPRLLCVLLALCLLAGGLTACSGQSEIPDGYQYATCAGEYFRLFVPTQWTVNTESGVSGAYLSIDTSVSMIEVPFDLTDAALTGTGDGTETAEQVGNADTDGGSAENSEESSADSSAESSADSTDRTATLEDFYRAHLAQISTLRDYTEEERYYTTVSGYKAVSVTYAATVAGTAYRFRQVLCRVAGRFYLFTFTAPAEKFDTYTDIVSEIIENIQFYNTPYEGSGDTKKVSDKVTAPERMFLVSDDKVAYRFFAPDGWTSNRESGAELVYVTEADGSRSNVSMMAYYPEDEGFSVADYWEMFHPHYEDALPGFTLLSVTEDEKIGDRNATVYVYTYTLGGVTYKTRQAVCVYSTMIYTMTYTALPDYYDSHLPEVERMQAQVVFRSPFKGA